MRTRRIGYCVSVVGPGNGATVDAIADAEAVGRLLAECGWITLCGGLAVGVMAAVARSVNSAASDREIAF